MFTEYYEDRIEVHSYFSEGGKIVGTERCDSIPDAVTFAKHQLTLFPYVEVVRMSGSVTQWGGYRVRNKEVVYRFR